MSLRSGSGVLAMMVSHVPGFAEFGPISKDDVTAEFVQHPDGAFEVKVSDSSGDSVTLHGRMPAQSTVWVQVKWDNGDISLEIEGAVADSQSAH